MKKILSTVTAAIMLVSALSPLAFAEETTPEFTVTITAKDEQNTIGNNFKDGNNNVGKTFTANVEVTSGKELIDHFAYSWRRDWTLLKNETNQSYTPGNDTLNWWPVRCVVTAYDADNNKLGKEVSKYVNGTSFGQMVKRKAIVGETSDYDKYVFKVDGKRFIILDDFDSKTETYYILADDTYGLHAFDTELTDPAAATFKSTEYNYTAGGKNYTGSSGSGNIAYWLNNDFIANGNNGEKLPQSIIDNLVSHKYYMAQNSVYKESNETLKIALLGRADYNKYIDKFSAVVNNDSSVEWWLRDVQGIKSGSNGAFGPFAVRPNWNSVEGISSTQSEKYVRPAFYLSEDFFTKVKLNVVDMGAEVKKIIAERYTDKQLADAGYSKDEIKEITGRETFENSISNVTAADADGKTTVSYTFTSDGTSPSEKVLVALYNGDSLANIAVEDKAVTAGENALTTQFNTTAYTSAKVFVWNTKTLEPKCGEGSWTNVN